MRVQRHLPVATERQRRADMVEVAMCQDDCRGCPIAEEPFGPGDDFSLLPGERSIDQHPAILAWLRHEADIDKLERQLRHAGCYRRTLIIAD